MTGRPTPWRIALIDYTIKALRAGGVWDKLDFFYLLAAHGALAARINLVRPGSSNCAAVNSPEHTVDRGYSGDGATSYLNTQFNPSNAVGRKWTQDSAHHGVWMLTDNAVNGGIAGQTASALNPRNTVDEASGRVNGAAVSTSSGSAAPSSSAYTAITRLNATEQILVRNGVSLGTFAVASATPTNNTLRIGAVNGIATFRAGVVAAYHGGAGLTVAELAQVHAALSFYLASIGAI